MSSGFGFGHNLTITVLMEAILDMLRITTDSEYRGTTDGDFRGYL